LEERLAGSQKVVGSSPTSSIEPDGGRTAGIENVGSIASRASMRTSSDFLDEFLEDGLDAHGSAVVQGDADSAADRVEVGCTHALGGFAVAE
jgi:hypothetical protein